MVRDAKLSGYEFTEFMINSLEDENDASIANYVLDIGSVALFRYIPNCPQKEELARQVLRIVKNKANTATD